MSAFSSAFRRGLVCFCMLGAIASAALAAAPSPATPTIGLDELKPGQTGVVWTVFQGNTIEPFAVEVTGVIRNALGPGKSLILCQLTDPRVQNMGAVAGMSGSPLYIDGRLAGALSYQIQRFETVRYAGFTPVSDLLEVSSMGQAETKLPNGTEFIRLGSELAQNDQAPAPRAGAAGNFLPLTPMFTLGGIAPQVASIFNDRFQALGLNVTAAGGFTASDGAVTEPSSKLVPGSAVAVALATGDITLAGTGTVSHVDGDRVLAFGHPMMGLGAVDLPMAEAEIVAILPSALNSFKLSNTGKVIGTVRQDRLSAIYGEVGRAPEMLPVEVKTSSRTLRFQTVRHNRLTPTIVALGLTQAILGSNENGVSEGFRISSTITYPDGQKVSSSTVYAGPQGFSAGLDRFLQRLASSLQNPIANIFPSAIAFAVEPLLRSPLATLDAVQLSQTNLHPGDELTLTVNVRDFQGAPNKETISIEIPREWAGRRLELVVARGDELDRLTGRPEAVSVSQLRSFDAYLDLLKSQRRSDGLYIAVVERASAFRDQMETTLDYPGSVERIARTADDERFRKREILVPLNEQLVLTDRLFEASYRRALRVSE